MKFYRQGDVGIQEMQEIPAAAKKQRRKNNRHVLAYGEVTGHAHAIHDNKTDMYIDDNGNLWLEVKGKSADVVHEEHKTITLTPGTYRISHQREYHPEEIRGVID